jgi:hypothetical protein
MKTAGRFDYSLTIYRKSLYKKRFFDKIPRYRVTFPNSSSGNRHEKNQKTPCTDKVQGRRKIQAKTAYGFFLKVK